MHFKTNELFTIALYRAFITAYKAIMTGINAISKFHYFLPTEKWIEKATEMNLNYKTYLMKILLSVHELCFRGNGLVLSYGWLDLAFYSKHSSFLQRNTQSPNSGFK